MTHRRAKFGQPQFVPAAGGYDPNYRPAWQNHPMQGVYHPYPPYSYNGPPHPPGHFQPCLNCPYRQQNVQQPFHAVQDQQTHTPQQHSANDPANLRAKYPIPPKKKNQKGALLQVEKEPVQQPETNSPPYKSKARPRQVQKTE